MRHEFHRQLVHLSGVIFIILAQYIGVLVSAWFFVIAASLFFYSCLIRREYQKAKLLAKIEGKLRDAVIKLERDDITRPFTGAVWFFFACGITFLIFPLHIASAAAVTLAVGDSLSTLVGRRFGRNRIVGKNTLEGSAACFIGSLFSFIFVGPVLAVAAAITATVAELLPDTGPLAGIKKKGLIDDNLLIPIIVGLVLVLLLA